MPNMARDLKRSVLLFLNTIRGSCYIVLIKKSDLFLQIKVAFVCFVTKQPDKTSNTKCVKLVRYKINSRHFDL